MLPLSTNSSATILIVDDEEFLLEYVRIVLVRAGYSVLTAQNGEEAWSLIVDDRHGIRLLLSDIGMPGSFDGFELAERVRAHRPDLVVLLMTGAPQHDDPRTDPLVSQGMLLRKPFFPDQLLSIMRQNLEVPSRLV
jgi:DNA-binding NtrC family response regulator